jgi:hypothetical protein
MHSNYFFEGLIKEQKATQAEIIRKKVKSFSVSIQLVALFFSDVFAAAYASDDNFHAFRDAL